VRARRGPVRSLGILLLGGWWLWPLVASGSTVVVSPELPRTPLVEHVEVLEDPEGRLGLDEVRSPAAAARFRAPTRPTLDFGYSRSSWWLRFRLHNPTDRALDLALEVGVPLIDEIVLYAPTPGGGYASTTLGLVVPFEERVLPHRRAAFPISAAPHAAGTYYVRVRTTGVVSLPIHVSSMRAFHARHQEHQWWLGLFYGALLALLAYNFFIYWSTREAAHLWYVAHTGVAVLVFACADGVAGRFWPGPGRWQQTALAFFVSLMGVCALQFCRHYLALAEQARSTDRLLQALVAVSLACAAAVPFLAGQTAVSLFLFVSVGVTGVIFPVAILRVRAGFAPARLFAVGWCLLLLGAGFGALAGLGVLPFLGTSLLAVKAGLLAERSFSSLGLANRINELTTKGIELRQLALDAGSRSELEAAERRRAEETLRERETQLRQAQKMETVGQLAGGIAHDFNNLLTPVLGHVELALLDLSKNDPLYEELASVREAAERASVLTRQLLAMSRKQVLELRVININDVIVDFHGMLRRLTREDIEIELRLAPDVGRVRADASQINQIVMNLALNAADSMSHGGRLRIETANVELGADANTRTPIPPGPYVVLSLSDTGSGMEAETLARIFDPFFTTKERGRGTGLGLATVLGIASQHGGSTSVESRPGEGSTFRVYLPKVDEALEARRTAPEETGEQRGSETILVMEDDEMVRKLSQNVLRHHGYEVLAPESVEEALELASGHRSPIHLLLTDVVMPGMNGSVLWQRLRSDRPQLKVLFMSGYTDDVIAHHGVEEEHAPFLQKPFSVKSLTEKVRMVLDAAG